MKPLLHVPTIVERMPAERAAPGDAAAVAAATRLVNPLLWAEAAQHRRRPRVEPPKRTRDYGVGGTTGLVQPLMLFGYPSSDDDGEGNRGRNCRCEREGGRATTTSFDTQTFCTLLLLVRIDLWNSSAISDTGRTPFFQCNSIKIG